MDDSLILDLKPLRKALVQQSPFLRRGLQICRLHFVRQGERQIERSHGLVVVDAQAVDALFGTHTLPFDALLLLSEQRITDLVGVVGDEKLPFLPFKLGELRFGLGHLLGGQQRHAICLRLDGLANLLAPLVAQLLVSVGHLYGGLDSLDTVAALFTFAVLPTAADEVFVLTAPAFGA